MSRYTSTIVGLLSCQNEPYLQTLTTRVVGCKEIPKTKKTPVKYEVELEDTVLFPEGGGQPSDLGSLSFGDATVPVNFVKRDGLLAKHEADSPVSTGTTVNVKLEWARRLDHMQQHTGQHLLSAIFDTRKLDTLSWSMGDKFNYIELPRKVTRDELDSVQSEVNRAIQDGIEISTSIVKGGEEKETKEPDVTAEKIPDNYDVNSGVIRVVKIGDLDKNPCCGTHLASTREIGAIALLHTQSIRGTNCRVFFMCGDRVHKYASEAHSVIKTINSQLSCHTEDIESKIAALNQNLKETTNREKMWMTEVATFTAVNAKEDLKTKNMVFIYKPEASLEFLNVIAKEIGDLAEGKTTILACGQGAAGGAIMIVGDKLDEVSAKVKDIVVHVKGGGKGRWQGKVTKWDSGAADALETYALGL
ncbi:putative alanyl-tRNA editing protein [Yarrowia sp. B02]|nr:putative alanyl-tRNA editing protein [Yarrowia sp. B02]